MSDHTTDGISNANKAPKAGKDFNAARQQQQYEITQLPPEAQQKAAMMESIYDKRVNGERNRQQKAHEFRIRGAKIELLQEYIKQDAPRPNDPRAIENDLRIIDERASEMVREKEQHFQNKIEFERFEMLNEIIQEDKQKQADPAAHVQDTAQAHEIEHEQER